MSDTSVVHDPSTNVPDYAAEETGRLEREYLNLNAEVGEILAEARNLPPVVEDADTADIYTGLINRMRDVDKKVEGFREAEGTPYLRRKTAVDSFFFSLRERLFKRKKTDKSGGADVLEARVHSYNMKRLEEERQARLKAEAEARAAEEKARQEREETARLAREAEAKAARARSAASRAAAEEAARIAAEAASKAAAEEEAARAVRQDAQAAAQAKPADLVRERGGGGLNTMRMVWYVEIEDSMKLDPAALWPFIRDGAKLAALKSWAKTTQYKKAMPGAVIEERPDTVTRR